MKCVIGSGVVLLVLPVLGFAAGASEVADAVMNGDTAAVRKLVEQHADVNAPQADGGTALHWAVFHSDQELVDLLLHAGANAKVVNHDGSTPLWLACINGNAAIIAELLNAGADVNEHLPLGRTPLMAAARTGNVDAVRVLLDHGAQVNAKESLRGTTALMWAADQGQAGAIQFLIQHGADIAARSDPAERGRGPALGKANDPRKQVAALGAAQAAGQASPDLGALRTFGETPTPAAAPQGRGGRGRGGQAAGGAAAGADQGFDVNDDAAVAAFGFRRQAAPKDGGGLTPMIYAVLADSLDSVKALLAAGANVNQVSAYGWSPLLVATQNRFYRLGAYLLEHGADVNLPNKGG
jgi:uncharacterized protein